MLSFVFVVTSLCLMGVMSIGNIKIIKRNAILLWTSFVILLSWLAYQFELNGAINYDLSRHYNLLAGFRIHGVPHLIEHLEVFPEKSWYILLYVLSRIPNVKFITLVSCVVIYAIFGWIMLDTFAQDQNKISIKQLFFSLLLFEGTCDYGYRVATEVRNALAVSLLALGIYCYVRYERKVLFIVLSALAASFHTTCIIFLFLAVIYKVFPKVLMVYQWFFLLWQPLQRVIGTILSYVPISYIKYVGNKILAYSDAYEYHHFIFYMLFALLMFLYIFLLNNCTKNEFSKNQRWLFGFLMGISLFSLGSIGSVPVIRFPIVLSFFSPMFVKKAYSGTIRYGKVTVKIMCGVSFLVFVYWVLYMYKSLHAFGATWIF